MNHISVVSACGGIYGTYLAGILRELSYVMDEHGITLDRVHTYSAGAWTFPYFIAAREDTQQLGSMEMIWLYKTCGAQLFNFKQFLRKHPVLQLSRMRSILRRGALQLNMEALFQSDTLFEVVVTDMRTGNPIYFSPNKHQLFRALTASAAMPFLSAPVKIAGTFGIDGGIADPMPIQRALDLGSKKIVVIMNEGDGIWDRVCSLISKYSLKNYHERTQVIADKFKSDERVFFICNANSLPLQSFVDTDATRIFQTYEQAKKDFYLLRQQFVDWVRA